MSEEYSEHPTDDKPKDLLVDKFFGDGKDKTEEENAEFDEETKRTMGTAEQTMVISNYPTQEIPDKLRIPFIEKQNGNLCIKCMKNDDFKNMT